MSHRTHMARYPTYSPKHIWGPMPRWIKNFAHRLERREVREALVTEREVVGRYKEFIGRTRYMWY